MALREIITSENPILRRKAKKVAKITPALRALADDMIETMRASARHRAGRAAGGPVGAVVCGRA